MVIWEYTVKYLDDQCALDVDAQRRDEGAELVASCRSSSNYVGQYDWTLLEEIVCEVFREIK